MRRLSLCAQSNHNLLSPVPRPNLPFPLRSAAAAPPAPPPPLARLPLLVRRVRSWMEQLVAAAGVEYEVDLHVGNPKRDFSGKELGTELYECTYGAFPSSRMVKRVPDGDLPLQYTYLCSLEDPTVLAVYDFVRDDDGMGYLVLESADGSFKEWVQSTVTTELFITTSPGKVRLSPILRNMFLKVAGVVDNLIERKCCPFGLNIDDLYIKVIKGGPALKVLLDYKVDTVKSGADVELALAAVRGIINYCCQFHNVELDDSSSAFMNYFGRHWSASHLKSYPDSWTDEEKKNYIFMIIHGDMVTMGNAIVKACVDWPWDPNYPPPPSRLAKAVPIVQDIYLHHMNLNPPVYYGDDGLSYARLSRNVFKSFEIPQKCRADIRDPIAFLRKMEELNPAIWTSLYEQIGPLEGGELIC